MHRVTIPPEGSENPGSYVIHTYAPRLTGALANLARTVYQDVSLPIRVVEAARVRTAQINGCLTCQTWRAFRDLPGALGPDVETSFVGRADAAPDEEFYAAIADWRSATVFDERERLAIEFAERMGEAPRSFEGDDAFWERMHAHYTDDEIVELTVSVGTWIASGRLAHILEVDPEVCVTEPVRSALVEAGTA